jgi:hypothetical protein
MATSKEITNLVINKVESQAVYDYMVANNLINDDELYLVQGESASQGGSYGVKLMTADEYDAVTDWTAVLNEGEIAWRCE